MGRRGAFKSGPNTGPRPVPLIQRTRKFLQVQGKINSRIRERESAADSSPGDKVFLFAMCYNVCFPLFAQHLK